MIDGFACPNFNLMPQRISDRRDGVWARGVEKIANELCFANSIPVQIYPAFLIANLGSQLTGDLDENDIN